MAGEERKRVMGHLGKGGEMERKVKGERGLRRRWGEEGERWRNEGDAGDLAER